MESKIYLVGSKAFFSGLEGFKPKDTDRLRFVEKGNGFNNYIQRSGGAHCDFLWVMKPKQEMIDYALQHGPAMQVGKFLVPEVAAVLGLTVEDLQQLRPLIDKLDAKHEYQRVIADAYQANGSFTLTEEQRLAAFEKYRESRPEKAQEQFREPAKKVTTK